MTYDDGNHVERPGAEDNEMPIVAIGASAGGVGALQSLFAALPEHTGAAFVVVVHLDPQHPSELPAILAARTRMPVVQVAGTVKLQADHVYVIPPGRRLQMVDHEISALEFDEPRGHRAPIDLFLRSVAERLGDGFAVILSGAGSDGSIGVRAVKEAGGIILVQDPAEAEYDSMPRSAIATGVADFILPVREIASRLVELVGTNGNATTGDLHDLDEDMVRRIVSHLRVRTGHDFSKYKRPTVLRRIARRMQVTRTDSLGKYYDALRESPEEARALLGDLLISVTTFFRDPEAFAALAQQAIPELFKDKGTDDPIRVWVSGCATGEEAYSLAMMLLEEAGRHGPRPPIQVFGSDLDTRALAAARDGRFPAAIEADVSEERLRRFFVREGDRYRVRQELRDTVLFAFHDLLKDPPFSHVDLVSCRNVLIYLDRDLQEQVCGTFHYALNSGGFLFLGSSETAEIPPGLFRLVDRGAHLYQSIAPPGEKPRLVPRLLAQVRAGDSTIQLVPMLSPTAALNEALLHRRALEQLGPPSMLVDEGFRVIHLSDNAGRFVTPSGGPLSNDAADLVRPELRFELRSALHRVFEQQQPTLSLPIAVKFNGAAHRVHLQVKPVHRDDPAARKTAVVMFIEGDAIDDSVLARDGPTSDQTVRRLTQELELMQARLQTVREESDGANGELRAANEELQSINEEYRSTSEELETSREELQSINEELQTVNAELKLKLEAVSRAHSDLQNLMAATDFGTLFLDSGLRIKRFTDRVRDVFSITVNDEGRPITDFAQQLDYDDLIKDARTVLAELVPIQRLVHGHNGRWYDVRIRPYRTVEDKIDGVVITFVDATERHQIERQSQRQKHLIDLSRDPIFVWDFDGGIVEWNRGSEELYGYGRDAAVGKPQEQLLSTTVPGSSFAELKVKLLREGSWRGALRQKTKEGRELTVESRLLIDSFDGRRLVLESTRDVTARLASERRLRLLLAELTHRVRNTLAVVQAIARHTLPNSQSKEDFVERFQGRLLALASAHTLLVGSDWKGADLAELARLQLAPYVADDPDCLRLRGAAILLSADLATPFGLVLHELATNAAKYGSLSAAGGTVTLSWTTKLERNNQRTLQLVWQEAGGPTVGEPAASGLGTTFIEGVIPGAQVTREFRPDGFVCTIALALPEAPENDSVDQF